MKSDERRQAIKQQREQLIQDLEAVYMAAFDRLGELEGEVGEVKAAQLTQMILNSKTAAIEPLEKEIEKPVITTPCLLYTSPSPRDAHESRMPSSA